MKKTLCILVSMMLFWAAGCGDVQCDSDADCADGEVCAEAGGVLFASRVCVAAADVVTNNSTPDMTSDLATTQDMAVDMSVADSGEDFGMMSDMQADAQQMDMSGPDMPCVPRSSQDICAAIGAECGSPEVEECGAMITLNCGSCTDPEMCQDNSCVCEPESDEDFCTRNGAECGTVTEGDNCGVTRTVDCGMCQGNEQCGEEAPNVCGCPCQIDGTCYANGAANPMNPCEVCDPGTSARQWTVDSGRSCSDGDLCTTNDTCNSNGSCVGDAVVCNSSSDCRTSACNPSTGACVETNEPNGSACIAPGPNCVSHFCQSGACQASVDSGTCLISGTCYQSGTNRPGNACEECRPSISQSSWSNTNAGSACESDGLSCTNDVCDGNGTCDHNLATNTCLIGGDCYDDTDRNPSQICQWCDPSNSTTSWSNAANQQCNSDGLSCTTDICNSSGQCTHPVQSGNCLINGTCYTDGTERPSNECQSCQSSSSTNSWSFSPSGTACSSDGVSCTNDQCDGSGNCEHPIRSNRCLISSTCYNAGEASPFDCCRGCNPAQSQVFFTGVNDGLPCGSGCSCLSGLCRNGPSLCIDSICPIQ